MYTVLLFDSIAGNPACQLIGGGCDDVGLHTLKTMLTDIFHTSLLTNDRGNMASVGPPARGDKVGGASSIEAASAGRQALYYERLI